MGAELSTYLEQDALLSDNGVLLENHLVSKDSVVTSVRRSSADIAQRSQVFAFCQHWDLVRVTEFLRWYTDLVRLQKQREGGNDSVRLADVSDAHCHADRLAKDITVLEDLLQQVELEIESVHVDTNAGEVDSEEIAEIDEDDDDSPSAEDLLTRKRKTESELREKVVALSELKLHLLASIDGVDLREIVQWPLFIKAVTHVHFQETVRASVQSSRERHPACAGFAMRRESEAKGALDEYNQGDILLPPPAQHEIDGHTDDSASSSAASGDESEANGSDEEGEEDSEQDEVQENTAGEDHPKSIENGDGDSDAGDDEDDSASDNDEPVHPIASESVKDAEEEQRQLSEEALAEHSKEESNQIVPSGKAIAEALMKQPRIIKRTIPDWFDPAVRNPIFFGYSYDRQKNRVDEILEKETITSTKEDAIFEMKIKFQKDKLEATLASERGKLQSVVQKESEIQGKRERHWAKRQADLDRAKKELDPTDVYFRTHEAQDLKTKEQEAFEDAEIQRQRQNIDGRMKTAEQECTSYVEKIALVRCTDRPLGDVRLKFHGEELEKYEREVNTAKSALASAQEEYVALTSSKLRAPGQESKLRVQVLFAEDQIKSRENELERICKLHENEQFLFERAQEEFDKEQLFVPLFTCLNAESASGFAFRLTTLALALMLGAGGTSVADKIKFLFEIFGRSNGRRTGASSSIQILSREAFAEILGQVFTVLSRIGDIHPSRALTRTYLLGIAEREFLKLHTVALSGEATVAETLDGMTLHEFSKYCMETIDGSKYLCELLGHKWKYEQLSRFVMQHMTPIHQYRLGLINVNDLKYALARQVAQPREELSHWKKAVIHERALAMGENDPLKTDYSKYLPKRRAKLLSNVVPLDHGGYRNLLHYRMEVILRSAVRLQTTWRARKGRQAARLAAEKQAFYHARGLALEEARQRVEKEWGDRDGKPAHSVDKMKLEAKIRMKQVKLRTKGNAFSREQVLALMTEEAVQQVQKEVENRFREMEEELGYLKHAEALQLPHAEMGYLKHDIAKGLLTQLVHAKQESASVSSMLESIATNEAKAKQRDKAKKRKRDESDGPAPEVPETDATEEVETHFVDKDADTSRHVRSMQRKEHMIHGRFPPELYSTGFTLGELSLQMILAFPDPPLSALKERLKQVCDGMTDFKMAEFLQELPSKRHICDYVTAFRRYDGSYDTDAMENDLYEHFRMVRGSSQLAVALINIFESDLEFGLTQKLLITIQEENEKVLREMVALESSKVASGNAVGMAKKLIRMGYKHEVGVNENQEITTEVDGNQQTADPRSLFFQKEKHNLEQRRKKALDAHNRLVEAMKAWKEAEWSLVETERSQLHESPSYPILPLHRTRWSERFQNAMQLKESSPELIQAKYTEIQQICQDFISTATAIALTGKIKHWALRKRRST
ncbi:hypothetical protein PHYBOEH_004282 [Phytophthora boehmeriae]|uniref:Uncharacterized protein n=1 Tax=Phytophthora boehmeriae TaxID=109152 RepID=A0A8T1WNR8_9STRA|nr:hypothetical protein PHYBOEH_004282 [Phytophthora boehmeriae]